MFWNLFWPIALITLANCFYNICTKSTPEQANPFLSLCVTYLTAAAVCISVFIFSQSREAVSLETQLDGADARFGSGSLRSRLHPYVSCRMENQHGFFGD